METIPHAIFSVRSFGSGSACAGRKSAAKRSFQESEAKYPVVKDFTDANDADVHGRAVAADLFKSTENVT